jgi:hypothetical protein
VIISASCRTDIAAFYADWFYARLVAGRAVVRNPYSGQPYTVDLRPESVSGIVFWTRNFGPMLGRLETLRGFGRPFVVQYTVTGYPRALEAAVIEPAKAVEQMRRLAGEVHPQCPVWRYDPIVTSSVTPADFHLANFERLAARLEGSVDEVVISFAQIYEKTRRNLNAAGRRHGLQWEDPPDETKLQLAARLGEISRARGMQLTVCTQPQYVTAGSEEARCVDARRLSRIGGVPLQVKLKGVRAGCACYESRDIGEYDTCPHGCAYCYAVRDRRLALARYQAHRPEADALLPLEREPRELPLFPGED